MSRAHALLLLPALALAACTGSGGQTATSGPSSAAAGAPDDGDGAAGLRRPTGVAVLPGTGGALATATSQALYERAPVVVVAPAGESRAQTPAASLAVAVGAPLLLSPSAQDASPAAGDAVAREVERLDPDVVVAVGSEAQSWAAELDDVEVVDAPADPAALEDLVPDRLGASTATAPAAALTAVARLPLQGAVPLLQLDGGATPASAEPGDGSAELPDLDEPVRSDGTVVLASASAPDALAAVATARSAGAAVHLLAAPDPRSSGEVVQALSARAPSAVLALGDSFGDAAQLERHVAVASTGVSLPAGGQLVLPGKLYVALYGHPGSDALGVLGEQGVDATIARAKEVAAQYEQAGSTVPVVPTLEIITSVASSALGDGDYSDESEIAHIRPLVDAAGRSGVYVVLDLQPGYDDFLTQAKAYEELLALPHVGLALDPEWRLRPGERHLRQIGRVSAEEVNSVVTWLADLTRDRRLPQKMLLLHQFKTFMLENRERIDVSRPELSVVVQMDGHGAPGTKLETWNILRPGTPEGMRWGWKNFYDEDKPTLTPAQTLEIEPTPVFVSYQ